MQSAESKSLACPCCAASIKSQTAEVNYKYALIIDAETTLKLIEGIAIQKLEFTLRHAGIMREGFDRAELLQELAEELLLLIRLYGFDLVAALLR